MDVRMIALGQVTAKPAEPVYQSWSVVIGEQDGVVWSASFSAANGYTEDLIDYIAAKVREDEMFRRFLYVLLDAPMKNHAGV